MAIFQERTKKSIKQVFKEIFDVNKKINMLIGSRYYKYNFENSIFQSYYYKSWFMDGKDKLENF